MARNDGNSCAYRSCNNRNWLIFAFVCGVGIDRSRELACNTDDRSLKYIVCGDSIVVELAIGLDPETAGELDIMRDTRDGV